MLMNYIGVDIDIFIDNIADYILHSNTPETPVSWRPSSLQDIAIVNMSLINMYK